jgi:hypothetical protein
MELNTPVVGILPARVTEDSLVATEANLSGLGHPVFSVMGNESHKFWGHLQTILGDHDWELNPRPRQERLLRSIETQLTAASKLVDLDQGAVDRLADRVKQKLSGAAGKWRDLEGSVDQSRDL